MEIEVDYNPTPSSSFFISVALSKKEAVSFDFTTKAHRITKQILVDKKIFPKNQPPTSEWDALVLKDGKFIKKYHVKWIDMKQKDWCNNEVWKTVKKKTISDELTKKLLNYSRFISDNYKDLDKSSDEMKKFECLLKEEMNKFIIGLNKH